MTARRALTPRPGLPGQTGSALLSGSRLLDPLIASLLLGVLCSLDAAPAGAQSSSNVDPAALPVPGDRPARDGFADHALSASLPPRSPGPVDTLTAEPASSDLGDGKPTPTVEDAGSASLIVPFPAAFAQSPGTTWRDCETCPVMVAVPPGSFEMGAPPGEAGRNDREGPVRTVTIPEPFAVGVYEVTFDEWDACAREAGCRGRPDDTGWGRGKRPVINVSWKDAKRYVEWLSEATGKAYRLLSEAEWEYVARAGTRGPTHFGGTVERNQANYAVLRSYRRKTVAVGSYPANPFGLHDMLGNVWEWVEDCWHGDYTGAPADGSAWTTGGDCSTRILRGGSWSNRPEVLRSAFRFRYPFELRSGDFGFRVARAVGRSLASP